MRKRALTMLAVAWLLPGCGTRTPVKYLIPSSYEGVVVVLFDQPGFPAIPNQDGYLVYSFPDDGIIITSSKPQYGRAADQFLDVLPDGSHRMIPYRDGGGRCERFSATGSRSVLGEREFVYCFTAIGSDAYWQGKDGREYDRKIEEAMKLARSSRQKSEQDGAANGSQPFRSETNRTSSAAGSRR